MFKAVRRFASATRKRHKIAQIADATVRTDFDHVCASMALVLHVRAHEVRESRSCFCQHFRPHTQFFVSGTTEKFPAPVTGNFFLFFCFWFVRAL